MNIKIKLNNKKVLTYFLALTLLASPILANAEPDLEVRPISTEVIPIMAEEVPNYIEFTGKITKIDKEEDRFSILAENDLENAMDKLVAHLSHDVVLLDEGTMDFISMEDFEEGMEVSIYYEKDTMMMLSYPGQLSPDLVVVKDKNKDINIKVDKFDKELVSDDNGLKLNLNDAVELVDLEGNKIEKEDLGNKDLVVFYTASTRSIPAQTTPQKVVAIKNHEVDVLHYLNLNSKRLNLDYLMHKTENDELMVPLRQVAEALGFNILWDQESKSIKIEQDGYSASLRIGSKEYQYFDMILELSAPQLIDSKTYVPVDFIQNILVADVEVTMDGILEVRKY